MGNVQGYIAAIAAVQALGEGVEAIVEAIKGHAQASLTPEEFAALEAAWQSDVEESARNAGIPPEPGA